MDAIWIYLIIGIFFLIIGYFLGSYIRQLKTKSSHSVWKEQEKYLTQRLENYDGLLELEKEEKAKIRSEKEDLGHKLTRYEVDMKNLQLRNKEQKEEIDKIQEKFTKEFENLANKILDEKSSKFTKQNKENLENILNPLKEKIKTFEDKVENFNFK